MAQVSATTVLPTMINTTSYVVLIMFGTLQRRSLAPCGGSWSMAMRYILMAALYLACTTHVAAYQRYEGDMFLTYRACGGANVAVRIACNQYVPCRSTLRGIIHGCCIAS